MELRLELPGVTFSTLLSAASQRNRDVEGLLLGSVVRTSQQILVDDTGHSHSAAATTHTTQQYVLRHFLITGSSGSFYEGTGAIKLDTLLQYVRYAEANGMRVIGWFRSRRRALLRLTQRESMVWRALLKLGPRHGRKDFFAEDPLCALFTLNPQPHTTALTFEYRFIDPSVGAIDATVCNLGSSSAAEYRTMRVMWANVPGLPAAYTPAVAPSRTVAALDNAHSQALANLVELARSAQEAQQQCVDLEEEIASLQRRIAAQRVEGTVIV